MRKFPIFLIGLLIIISIFSCITLTAAAEELTSVPYDTIIADEEYYYNFTSPSNITINGSVFAVLDSGKILIFADGINDVISIPYNEVIKEMHIIDHYLFIINDSFEISIYDIQTGSIINDVTDIITANAIYPTSMTYNNETHILYILNAYGIRSFNVDCTDGINITYIEEIINVSEEPRIYLSNYIVYTSDKLLIFNLISKKVFSLNLSNLAITTTINSVSDSAKYILANNLYILLIENNKVTRYLLNGNYIDDILTTGGATDNTVSDIGGVGLYGDNLYISNTSYSAVKIFTITSTSLIYNNMFGSHGTSLIRLNKPEAAAYNNNYIYIADTMNDRVIIYNIDSNNNIIGTPVKIGNSGIDNGNFIRPDTIITDYSDGLYVSDSTERLQYFYGNNFVASYNFIDISSISVAGDDTVYVADQGNNQIYSKEKDENSFTLFKTLDTIPLNLTVSKSGNILYVGDSVGIKAYSVKGILLPYSIKYEDYGITNPISICVDYNGNMYVLYNDNGYKIDHLIRNINDYTLSDTFILDNANKPVSSPSGMNLTSNGKLIIANTNYHNIIIIDNEENKAVTESSSTYNHPSEIISPTRIAYINSASTIYYNPSNYEDITSINEGECVAVLNESTFNNIHYYYIEYEGEKAYIRQSNTILLNSGEAPMEYAKSLHPSMNIYMYPSVYSPKIFSGVSRNEMVLVISNVAELNGVQVWDWYEISYNDTTGYVLKTEVIPASMPEVIPELFYGKIKSDNFGEKVNLYSLEDTHSAIITTITDGTKVEMNSALDEQSEFTLIKYGDYTGYVRTENLVLNGLTTGQLLSLILAAVTFTATISVIIISKIIKRDNSY